MKDSLRRDASREEDLDHRLELWREVTLRIEHLGPRTNSSRRCFLEGAAPR